ncbi:MAG: hypothetical protein ACOYWZ_12170 [Bacillota bacterium]
MEKKPLEIESSFDINEVSFENVNKDFEKKFKDRYENSLSMISDDKDPLTNASGINTLGMLEKMAQRIEHYDENSDFEDSFNAMLKEYEPFTET